MGQLSVVKKNESFETNQFIYKNIFASFLESKKKESIEGLYYKDFAKKCPWANEGNRK